MLCSKYLSVLGVHFGVSYTVGMLGNAAALYVLRRTRDGGHRKYAFMLRCLIVNDAVALNGLLAMFFANAYRPGTKVSTAWTCRSRVLLRFVSVESGPAVTFVMAAERWLALTKPFVYQKCINLWFLKKTMFALWFGVLCLACAPFFGFGIYWDEDSSTCVRYRHAKKTLDVMYVYVYFSVGLLQCLSTLYMNFKVMRLLNVKNVSRGKLLTCAVATKREKSFSWLMLLLSVTFLFCWIPHVVLIPLNRLIDDDNKMRPFNIVSDMLIVVHIILDPYLYVLQHWKLIRSAFLQPHSDENIKGIAVIYHSSSTKKLCEVS
ncbi:melanopsin-like [Sipha flava]|uniref:Melanopsin-like n=2 Tax=Sipha flava TaxID=143950 RepID=A0A8B8FVG0_9HEMI|nr:melanopsin-like [Sipha flava]